MDVRDTYVLVSDSPRTGKNVVWCAAISTCRKEVFPIRVTNAATLSDSRFCNTKFVRGIAVLSERVIKVACSKVDGGYYGGTHAVVLQRLFMIDAQLGLMSVDERNLQAFGTLRNDRD